MIKLLGAIAIIVSLCGCRTNDSDRYVGIWDFRGDLHLAIDLDLRGDMSYTMGLSMGNLTVRSAGSWLVENNYLQLHDAKKGTIILIPIGAGGAVKLAWDPDNSTELGEFGRDFVLKDIKLTRK